MLALMSTAKPPFLEIDSERFKSAVCISSDKEGSKDPKKERSTSSSNGFENAPSRKLQLLRVKGFPRLLPEGIRALVNYCCYLRELSLSYSLLSDELLMALSSEQQVRLETLRLEAHTETKPLPRISEKSWHTFASNLPDVNLVLLSYMADEEDQNSLLTSHVPVTHLYFGEPPVETTALRVAHHCPRLMELVIAAYGFGQLEQILIAVARRCPRLSAVGLGDCEITCSGLVEFVTLCSQRLRTLYVWETSLVEDSEYDIHKVSAKISLLLGHPWIPEYIPLW